MKVLYTVVANACDYIAKHQSNHKHIINPKLKIRPILELTYNQSLMKVSYTNVASLTTKLPDRVILEDTNNPNIKVIIEQIATLRLLFSNTCGGLRKVSYNMS